MSPFLIVAGILSRLAAIPPLYLAAWCALAMLSVVLVMSFRSRWGRRRPLYCCAVASLLVHVVLVGLTMAVRLVVGDGGAGTGPPIHVRLVDDIQREGPITLAAPPPLLVPAELRAEEKPVSEPAAKAQESPSLASEPTPSIAPPPLLALPEPVAEEKIEEKIVLDDEVVERPPTAAVVSAKSPEPVTPIEKERESLASPPEAGSPLIVTEVAGSTPPATSPYARRNAPDRLAYSERHGGSVKTEAAVAAALRWLAKSQSADGRWDANRFGAGVEMAVQGQDRGGAGADADSGISALALLAFLGAGHSHVEGDYQANVAKGLEFLMRGQSGDGHLASDTSLYARMYCHSMASFALAEALAMTGDRRLEPAVRRAVDYSLRAQHPATGGWRYRPGDLGDTSQLGWQLMSLWSAERAGIKIPAQTWTGAERFLRSVRRGRQGGLASYRADGPASTPMTAEAMYCRLLVGTALGDELDPRAMDEATATLLAAPPEPSRVNLYYWYYGTLALHHRQESNGGRQESNGGAATAWQSWNSALTQVLLDSQLGEGPEAGSWEPNCMWGGYGGRVYSTAIATMCFEVYYRYATEPADEGWTAERPEVRRLPH